MLKEVEMPQPLDPGVMDRMQAGGIRMLEAPTRDEIDRDGQRLPGGIEIHALNVPGRLDTQGGFKQLVVHDRVSVSRSNAALCRTQPEASVSDHVESKVCSARLSSALDPKPHPHEIQKRQQIILPEESGCAKCDDIRTADGLTTRSVVKKSVLAYWIILI